MAFDVRQWQVSQVASIIADKLKSPDIATSLASALATCQVAGVPSASDVVMFLADTSVRHAVALRALHGPLRPPQ